MKIVIYLGKVIVLKPTLLFFHIMNFFDSVKKSLCIDEQENEHKINASEALLYQNVFNAIENLQQKSVSTSFKLNSRS
jgi:hypothetical protein